MEMRRSLLLHHHLLWLLLSSSSSSSSSPKRWLWLWLLLCSILACLLLIPFSSPSLLFLLPSPPPPHCSPSSHRFLQVPQIAWGLNNQKIALARAALTARSLNRSLLLPSLSASLFYKQTHLLQPLPFDRLFSLPRFNSLCHGFVSIASPSQLPPATIAFNVTKGSGRRWTAERDLQQLHECRRNPHIDRHVLLRFVGKNPFLWHDHWPLMDYARVFQCLVLVDTLSAEADTIVSKLRQTSSRISEIANNSSYKQQLHLNGQEDFEKKKKSVSQHSEAPLTTAIPVVQNSDEMSGTAAILPRHLSRYVSVHMRIEKDWMIHCKKTEDRARTRKGEILNICSSKEEIINRVSRIPNLWRPSLIHLAVADVLLQDSTLLDGWKDGLVPFEKKKLGVLHLYDKYPYLIQSAIDYEVCLRSDIFVGNSFSTFSSLIVLERTLKMLKMGSLDACGTRFASYAYNLPDANGGPQPWVTNLSEASLQTISYGTNRISCVC